MALSIVRQISCLLATLGLIVTPLAAQHRQPASGTSKSGPKIVSQELPPTFDTLLTFDSYKIYVEVRGLDQVIRASGVNDVLDPLIKLTVLPKDLKTIVKWLNNHADKLSGSRVMFATWPAKAKIPALLCAIEFSSPEEARAFVPQLREFLPTVIHSPQPTLASSPGPDKTPPPYITREYGSLLLISESSFSLKSLRPKGSKLLVEDQNFRLAHDRFSSDPIFLYWNAALEDRRTSEAVPSPQIAARPNEAQTETPSVPVETSAAKASIVNESAEATPAPPATNLPEAVDSPEQQAQEIVTTTEAPNQTPDPAPMVMSAISRALFGGSPKWPEAVGAAVALESDSYNLRLLLLNKQEQRVGPLPFMPRLISGNPLTPASPSIFPADTEFLITASLDYSQIYEGILRTFANEDEEFRRLRRYPTKVIEADSPFAAYEKRLGIKIKDDLLPLLGHETAMSIPLRALGMSPPQPTPSPAPSQEESSNQQTVALSVPNPIFAVAIKDKERVRALLPKIIDSAGFKGASLLARSEKRGDTELVSYGDVFSYALIEDFLVLSPDTGALRHLVDSHLNYETLSSNSNFRNSTHWQPRQVIGQIYISPVLMESYNSFAHNRTDSMNAKMQELLSRLSPTSEPVTYALSNEGMGTLHELHVPKNLLMLMLAAISGEAKVSPMSANESIAQGSLLTIASAEETYKTTKGEGSFGSIDELVAASLIPGSLQEKNGYKIELTIYSDRFEARAVPVEYGKTGKMSYFIDQSRVLRGGDHGGGAATVSDRPLQ